MQVLTLSDHTSEKAAALESQREAEYAQAKDQHAQVLEGMAARRNRLNHAVVGAWKERRMFGLIRCLLERGAFIFAATPKAPTIRAADKEETVWKAGNDGEAYVRRELAKQLSDDWTFIAGYKNVGGEADVLLVGPQGIAAIEIKHINGRIFGDGDTWTRDKYDNYGNLKESDLPIRDRKGRGPTQQINGVANRLEAFLRKRNLKFGRVYRAVIFSHEKAALVSVKNFTVDHVSDDVEAHLLVRKMSDTLDSAARRSALDLIKRDHIFHAQRQPSAAARATT